MLQTKATFVPFSLFADYIKIREQRTERCSLPKLPNPLMTFLSAPKKNLCQGKAPWTVTFPCSKSSPVLPLGASKCVLAHRWSVFRPFLITFRDGAGRSDRDCIVDGDCMCWVCRSQILQTCCYVSSTLGFIHHIRKIAITSPVAWFLVSPHHSYHHFFRLRVSSKKRSTIPIVTEKRSWKLTMSVPITLARSLRHRYSSTTPS